MHGNEKSSTQASGGGRPRSRSPRRRTALTRLIESAGENRERAVQAQSDNAPKAAQLVVAELAVIRAAEDVTRSWLHGGYGVGLSSNLLQLSKAVEQWHRLTGAPEVIGRQLHPTFER